MEDKFGEAKLIIGAANVICGEASILNGERKIPNQTIVNYNRRYECLCCGTFYFEFTEKKWINENDNFH